MTDSRDSVLGNAEVAAHLRFVEKRDVLGVSVLVSYLTASARNLHLEPLFSRALCKHEIHELISTGDSPVPGEAVADVAYIGFFEVTQGGSLRVGDTLRIGTVTIGTVAGFDMTHMPNHLNIVIRMRKASTGADLGLHIGQKVQFTAVPPGTADEDDTFR